MTCPSKPLLRAVAGEVCAPRPIWLMRQAGRYLPEYRKTRARVGDFLELCLRPELAVEVTLQPVRRFGFDGAILFSDILVVPHGLGQRVWFEEGIGPRLEPVRSVRDLAELSLGGLEETLAPVYEAVAGVRAGLAPEVALIGFAGAPWTVASYMVEGGGSRDCAVAKAWAYQAPGEFARLIELLVEATTRHLVAQVRAGAEVLQLFDTWAGLWPEAGQRRWCLAPAAEIRRRVAAACPRVPLILFPRGAGALYEVYARESGADVLSLDPAVPLAWARERLQCRLTVQGNLDPVMLLAGGGAMRDGAAEILDALGRGPFVFNLGHGVLPETPPEHVADLVAQVRAWRP